MPTMVNGFDHDRRMERHSTSYSDFDDEEEDYPREVSMAAAPYMCSGVNLVSFSSLFSSAGDAGSQHWQAWSEHCRWSRSHKSRLWSGPARHLHI